MTVSLGFLVAWGREEALAAISTVLSTMTMPRSGTLKNMYVRLTNAPGAAHATSCVVYVNGIATGLQVLIINAATTGNDVSNSEPVSAGDLVEIELLSSDGGATAPGFVGCELQLDPKAVLGFGCNTAVGP